MKFTIVAMAISVMFIQGCASPEMQRSAKSGIDVATARAALEIRKAAKLPDTESVKRESEVETPYLFSKAVPISKEVSLPKALQKNVKTSLMFSDKETDNWISLRTLADRITRATGIYVSIAPDVYLDEFAAIRKADTNSGGVKPLGLVVPAPSDASMTPKAVDDGLIEQRTGKGANGRVETANAFYFPKTEGQLGSILDTVANKLHIHHKYDEATNTIHFYKLISKTWQTKLTSTSYSFNNGATGQLVQNTDSKSINSSNQSNKSAVETSLKDNVELLSVRDAIANTILTQHGKIYANTATGTITMSDTEEAINAADALIGQEAKNLNRGVLLRLRTIEVTRTDSDEGGFDVQGILNKALANLPNVSINTSSPGTLVGTNSGTMSVGVFSGGAASSQAIVSALRELGDVQVSSELPFMTKNRKGVTYDMMAITSYVPNTTPAAATTGGTGGNIGLNTAQIQTGLRLIMLPTLGSDDSGTISFKMEESSKPNIEKFSVGSGANFQAVEKPNYTLRNNNQDIPIRSGQSVLLVGFERVTETLNKRSMGEALPFLGGSSKVSRQRVLTLLQLSMQVIDN